MKTKESNKDITREILNKDTAQEMLNEYKNFAFKDNIVKLAIAFVLGGAFQKVVSSTSDNLIMPLINYLILHTGQEWREHLFEPTDGIKFETGKFLGATVDFLLISIFLFIIWKLLSRTIDKDKPSILDKIREFALGNSFYPLAFTVSFIISLIINWIAGIWTLMTFSMVVIWAQNRQWKIEKEKIKDNHAT
jgi:large conductance mechanosensitive channel